MTVVVRRPLSAPAPFAVGRMTHIRTSVPWREPFGGRHRSAIHTRLLSGDSQIPGGGHDMTVTAVARYPGDSRPQWPGTSRTGLVRVSQHCKPHSAIHTPNSVSLRALRPSVDPR